MKRGFLWLGVVSACCQYFARTSVSTGGCDGSGHCYVLAGVRSGDGSGADWSNACSDLKSACAPVHGVTYYMGTGLYAHLVLSDAGAGMGVIQRATGGGHGTDAGWSKAYDGQVTFSFDGSGQHRYISILSSNWTLDGVTGSGTALSGYGFTLAAPGAPGGPDCGTVSNKSYGVTVGKSGFIISDINIYHLSMSGCRASYGLSTTAFGLGCGACLNDTVHIAYAYSTGNNNFLDITNTRNSTFEYLWGDSFFTIPGVHAEIVATASVSRSGLCAAENECNAKDTLRYFFWKNCRSSGCFQSILSGGDPITLSEWKIYGGVIVEDQSGDGVFAVNMKNTAIYNVTLVNAHRILTQCSNKDSCALAVGNAVENSLLYNSTSDFNPCDAGGNFCGAPIQHDYNTFWSPSDTPPAESHGQTARGGCPLVNCSTGRAGDYRLAQPPAFDCSSRTRTCAGRTLPSPYDLDLNCRQRGANGAWERGAFAFTPVNPRARDDGRIF